MCQDEQDTESRSLSLYLLLTPHAVCLVVYSPSARFSASLAPGRRPQLPEDGGIGSEREKQTASVGRVTHTTPYSSRVCLLVHAFAPRRIHAFVDSYTETRLSRHHPVRFGA